MAMESKSKERQCMSAFGALQTVNDGRYPGAWYGQKAVPNRALAIFLAVAIVVGLVFPALGDERPSDPFGNHTAELNKDAPLVGIWESMKDKMQFEKAYFHECLLLKEPPCPSISTLVQKLDETVEAVVRGFIAPVDQRIRALEQLDDGIGLGKRR